MVKDVGRYKRDSVYNEGKQNSADDGRMKMICRPAIRPRKEDENPEKAIG